MTLTSVQRRTIDALTQIHETGKYSPDAYGTVANIKGDSGGLSLGAHQASLMSGNLYLLLMRYRGANGLLANDIAPYMDRIKAKDKTVGNNAALRSLLAKAGSDPIMQAVQDDFFYDNFMKPAINAGLSYGFVNPLSFAVIYDSWVHGSWGKIRDLTNAEARVSEEKTWIATYLAERRAWLTRASSLLAKTVYRMDTYLALVKAGNWDLNLPITAHGFKLTAAMIVQTGVVADTAPVLPKASATVKAPETVVLMNYGKKKDTNPVDAVKDLQKTLLSQGFYKGIVDGVFGDATEAAVKVFQRSVKLRDDGIAGLQTLSQLNLA